MDRFPERTSGPFSDPELSPRLIASGIGLASREELAGLCGVVDTVGLFEAMHGGFDRMVQNTLGGTDGTPDRLAASAAALLHSGQTDDMLRHRLWYGLVQVLGVRGDLPFSVRRLSEDATALGVMASRVLSPKLTAAEQRQRRLASARNAPWSRFGDRLREILTSPGTLLRSDAPLTFPDVVAREFASILDGLGADGIDGNFDPEIESALRRERGWAWTAVAASSGWIGMAAAVNAAGFAPYILAAQASAFIPFVSGPTLVSLLAVLASPAAIAVGLIGTAGLGLKMNTTVRSLVVARVSVILALRGLADPEAGLARASDAFRRLVKPESARPEHLPSSVWASLLTRSARLQAAIGAEIPPSPGPAPERWAARSERIRVSATDASATLGLTAAEMLYHAAAVDPRVVAAGDFWRVAEISDPWGFAAHAAEFAVRGADIALRGFTAEQVVMHNLIAAGHHVSLPTCSNNPGFDLLVDGHEIQVKCSGDLSVLRDHFSTYPDIPVIANAELVQLAADEPWTELVTTLEGFELEAVDALTRHAVEAGIDLASVDALAEAVAIGAFRGALQVLKGEIPASQLPAWLVVDSALRGMLVLAGGKAGVVIGLVAVGPAGALILAPVLGASAVFGLDRAKATFDRAVNPGWHDDLQKAMEQLRAALKDDLERRVRLLGSRAGTLARACDAKPGGLGEWLTNRGIDDAIFAAEELLGLEAGRLTSLEAMELEVFAPRAAPASPQVLSARYRLRNLLSCKPSTLDGAVRQAIGSAIHLRTTIRSSCRET